MKLWLLDRFDTKFPGYGMTIAVLVRAETEQAAREWANTVHGDEGKIWTDRGSVGCREVTAEGKPGVVLHEYTTG